MKSLGKSFAFWVHRSIKTGLLLMNVDFLQCLWGRSFLFVGCKFHLQEHKQTQRMQKVFACFKVSKAVSFPFKWEVDPCRDEPFVGYIVCETGNRSFIIQPRFLSKDWENNNLEGFILQSSFSRAVLINFFHEQWTAKVNTMSLGYCWWGLLGPICVCIEE